jgi:hypothetical protein
METTNRACFNLSFQEMEFLLQNLLIVMHMGFWIVYLREGLAWTCFTHFCPDPCELHFDIISHNLSTIYVRKWLIPSYCRKSFIKKKDNPTTNVPPKARQFANELEIAYRSL